MKFPELIYKLVVGSSTEGFGAPFSRKKLAQRRSRISQSMGGRELKLALRAPAV